MKIEIEVDEYVNKINDAYRRGFEDGMKAVGNTTLRMYPDPIGNPITNPAITWNIDKRDKISNDNDMYEKAPYWMNPNFKMPEWTCSTGTPLNQSSVTISED